MWLRYDPIRGGILLSWDRMDRDRGTPLCGGLLHAYRDTQGRITAIESLWASHGGLPLRGIHNQIPHAQGSHPWGFHDLQVGAFLFIQSQEHLTVWFGGSNAVPDPAWQCETPLPGLALWFTPETALAGWPTPGVGGRAPVPLPAGIRLSSPTYRSPRPCSSYGSVGPIFNETGRSAPDTPEGLPFLPAPDCRRLRSRD